MLTYTIPQKSADFLLRFVILMIRYDDGVNSKSLSSKGIQVLYETLFKVGIDKCKELIKKDFPTIICPMCRKKGYVYFNTAVLNNRKKKGLCIDCEYCGPSKISRPF